nr:uncharacterized protein LOC113822749 [Penaeus vannamei]
MYRDVTSQVSSCVGITDEFNIKVGLHQGSTLSPYIFDLIMDVLSEGIREEAPWTMLFADDIVLVCNTKESLREKLSQWKRALEDRGLKISRTKSEYLSFNDFEEENGVEMDDEIIKRVPAFKYLGSHVTEDGEVDVEVNQRLQSGWQAWRRFSGLLCDKKISARLKGKVYKTAVRPAILYGSETWPIKRVHEKKGCALRPHWSCVPNPAEETNSTPYSGSSSVCTVFGARSLGGAATYCIYLSKFPTESACYLP